MLEDQAVECLVACGMLGAEKCVPWLADKV